MSDKIEYSRLIQKRFSQPGVVPTIPASGATTLSQLVYTDLLIGEIAFNLPDKRMWFRAETEIVEIFGVSGGTYANLFIEGDSDTSINSIPNNDTGGLNVGEYNFTVGENNSTFADNSAVIAGFDNIINVDSDNSAIIGGSGNIISGATNVIMLGCENTDAFQSGSTYVQNLVITDLPTTGNTNTDLILLRGVNGAVTAIPVSDLPSGGAQNLLQVLQTGDYAAYGDTAYYLGQDGFLVDGTSTDQKSYLIDHNAFYTQISRSDDLNPSDGSTILLDSNGIRLESNSDVIFGANVVNNKITYDGQTMDVDNVNDYIASATTNSFMPKSYIDSLSATTYTFSNGLSESAGTVKLGGTLTQPTIINKSVYPFVVNGDGAIYLNSEDDEVQISASSDLTLTGDDQVVINTQNEIFITNNNIDVTKRGAKYSINYSTGWDGTTPDTMLTPKSYVDKNIMNNGSTANRPGTPSDFEQYFDTDLGYPIVYNGTNWVDYTGAIV